jgi:hypothetical protein
LGTSSRLATQLDHEMLVAHGVIIAASSVSNSALSKKTGAAVATELGDRYLLRYLLPHQVGAYAGGSTHSHWVTPTAFAPEETVSWLALPAPQNPRPYILLLKPDAIPSIWGPRWVRFGGGIEYYLPQGFPVAALAFPWELEVR